MTFATSDRDNMIIRIAILVCAALLSFKYFPGLESSGYYAGFVIDAIHPELMNKDPIVGGDVSLTDSPYKLTLYYMLPRIFGELWLDDRFVFIFYFLSVLAGFYLIDRLMQTLGRTAWEERIIVQLLFLKDHSIFENSVNLAHIPDFHHSALALPLALWVLWAAISGKRLITVLCISTLLIATSLQVAPGTILFALIAIAVRGNKTDKIASIGLLFAGCIAAFFVMFYKIDIPESDRLAVWNLFVFNWYEGMVAPFDLTFRGMFWALFSNGIFAFVLGACILLPKTNKPSVQAVKAVLITAGVAWIAVGLFVQFAPEALQYPQLLIFPIARQLQVPQILAYVFLLGLLFNWVSHKPNGIKYGFATVALLAMLISGPGNLELWTMLAAIGVVVAIVLHFVVPRMTIPGPLQGVVSYFIITKMETPFSRVALTAFTLIMAVALSYSIWHRAPAYVQLVKTGIHGASDIAPWRNVSTYLRQNTAKDAVVLPFRHATAHEVQNLPPEAPKISITRSVASRSGRAVPIPMMFSQGIHLDNFKFAEHQRDLINDIRIAVGNQDAARAMRAIEMLEPKPDYLIMPKDISDPLKGDDFPWDLQDTVDGFEILKRRP